MKIDLYNKVNLKSESYYNDKTYEISRKINNICEAILRLNIKIYQYKKGINYFINNYIQNNKEIMYYILLEILEKYDLKEEWINIYEKEMNKIKFRDRLQEKYKQIKNN